MYLISIDPHIKESALAVWLDSKLMDVQMVSTEQLITRPNMLIGIPHTQERYCLIEKQYVGQGRETSLELAITAGEIKGVFLYLGFIVEMIPVWGQNSWMMAMLSTGGRMPNRRQAKKLSLMIAQRLYPEYNFGNNHHLADAVLIGRYWLDKRKWMDSLSYYDEKSCRCWEGKSNGKML